MRILFNWLTWKTIYVCRGKIGKHFLKSANSPPVPKIPPLPLYSFLLPFPGGLCRRPSHTHFLTDRQILPPFLAQNLRWEERRIPLLLREIPKCSFGMSSEQIYFCTVVQHLRCHLQTIIRKAQLHVFI